MLVRGQLSVVSCQWSVDRSQLSVPKRLSMLGRKTTDNGPLTTDFRTNI